VEALCPGIVLKQGLFLRVYAEKRGEEDIISELTN